MAPPLLARPHLLRLPPALRASAYENAALRSFSSTPSRKLDLTQVAVAGPTAVLDGIHALGVPWYAALPIAGVLVRGILGYYFATVPGRKQAIVRQHLWPIINATSDSRFADFTARRNRQRLQSKTMSPRVDGLYLLVKKQWMRIKESQRIGKEFGAPLFGWKSFFNFGLLIAFTEAIRVKCGAREGLLNVILGPVERLNNWFWGNEKVVEAAPPPDPVDALVERIEAANAGRDAGTATVQQDALRSDMLPDGEAVAQSYYLAPQKLAQSYAEHMDPSLQTEGLAWCQDLTATDPTFLLPLALSATIAASVMTRPKQKMKSLQDKVKKMQEVNKSLDAGNKIISPHITSAGSDIQAALEAADKLNGELAKKREATTDSPFANLPLAQRVGLSLAFLFFFVSMKLPAGILLYLVPSLATGWLQRRWLDMKYPLPPAMEPCKRPLRIKVRKHFGDA